MEVSKVENQMVQKWMQGVLDSYEEDAELTLKYCRDILEYGQKNKDVQLMGFSYYYMAQTYYGLNDGDQFYENISKALNYLEEAKEWELVARGFNVLGIMAVNRGNAPVALDYYLSGLDYCKKYDIPLVESILNVNCGSLNLQCGRFRDAQKCLRKAYSYMSTIPENPNYHSYMVAIYQNLVLCSVKQGMIDGVQELLENIHKFHWEHIERMDRMGVYCVEALYYHLCGDVKQRDECMEQVDLGVEDNMILMDLFDDYYTYCELLLECGKDKEFWHIIDTMEPMVQSFNITHMQMKELSLKLKYYRNHGQNEEYLQAAGLYYELSEKRESETQKMIYNILSLRKTLDEANEAREEAEIQNQILAEKSETDALTQLPNRFKLNDSSEDIYLRSLKKECSFAVEILDIDYFKEYNDNYGHQAGDKILIQIANVIRDFTEAHNGFCARYGGDEFVIIYEDVELKEAVVYAQELKERVASLNMKHQYSKAEPIVTISQGVCCDLPMKGYRVWDYLRRADDMLYHIKKKSRNNYCVGDMLSQLAEG